jgi:hypothetical protein
MKRSLAMAVPNFLAANANASHWPVHFMAIRHWSSWMSRTQTWIPKASER